MANFAHFVFMLTISSSSVCSARDELFDPLIHPADVNYQIHQDMSSLHYCNRVVPRRNGIIYSHREAMIGYQMGHDMNDSSRWYHDDIDCTLTVMIGEGK